MGKPVGGKYGWNEQNIGHMHEALENMNVSKGHGH